MAATHLRMIDDAARELRRATQRRNDAIAAARDSGETWADIAAAAGMSRQGATKAAGAPARAPYRPPARGGHGPAS